MSANPPVFAWEVTMASMRVTLPNDDPFAPFTITTDINPDASSISTLTFDPDSTGIRDPACIVENGMNGFLRVDTMQFMEINSNPGTCITKHL